MDRLIKTIAAAFGALGGYLFGKFDGLLIALVVLMCVDYLTGVLIAIINKKLSSEIGAKGIAKKGFMLAVVIVANILDTQLLQGAAICRPAVITFYAANECISILENAGRLGVPLPALLCKLLEQLKEDKNNDSNV